MLLDERILRLFQFSINGVKASPMIDGVFKMAGIFKPPGVNFVRKVVNEFRAKGNFNPFNYIKK